jgi:Glycoside Hydrolase Family 113
MRNLYHLLLALIFIGCAAAPYAPKKINGVSFVAAGVPVDNTHTQPVADINANAAAVMPFGFIRSLDHPEIIHNTDRQWFGETRAGTKQYIAELRKHDIEIMIKPQIWVWNGKFTGSIMMTTEENWKLLENSYTNFILEYADLAEEVNAEVFCIGTELELFIKYRPAYWSQLIEKIRAIYSGKLTYAANWDEFWRTPFWTDVDYIGIDAYFPVSDMQTPTIEDCLKGWQKHKPGLKDFSKKLNKPILFTEFGYRSVDYAGREPWSYDRSMTSVNLKAQSNAMQAVFETVWKEDWFAGGFIWKWFVQDDEVGGEDNFMFTPQNKPVELLIKEHFAAN